jgi:hypothetical protein
MSISTFLLTSLPEPDQGYSLVIGLGGSVIQPSGFVPQFNLPGWV